MIDAAALDIFLGKTRVGTIARLDGDASIFTFDEVYLADQDRPTLSLAYKDANGEIIGTIFRSALLLWSLLKWH